jgi:hypothetical protein
MRLSNVQHDHAWKDRLLIRFIRLVSRQPVPDVVLTLLHRRDFFSDRYNRLLQSVLRGEHSQWTVGERELFAAFTARLEACHF